MRLACLALALVLAAPAVADVTATITTAQADSAGIPNFDARVTRAREKSNGNVCRSVGLPVTCDAAAITATGRNPSGTFHATNNAFARALLVAALKDLANDVTLEDAATFCARWRAATQAQRDAICGSAPIGLSAGCEACVP